MASWAGGGHQWERAAEQLPGEKRWVVKDQVGRRAAKVALHTGMDAEEHPWELFSPGWRDEAGKEGGSQTMMKALHHPIGLWMIG